MVGVSCTSEELYDFISKIFFPGKTCLVGGFSYHGIGANEATFDFHPFVCLVVGPLGNKHAHKRLGFLCFMSLERIGFGCFRKIPFLLLFTRRVFGLTVLVYDRRSGLFSCFVVSVLLLYYYLHYTRGDDPLMLMMSARS